MSTEPKQGIWNRFVEKPHRFFLALALTTLVLLALAVFVSVLFPDFILPRVLRSVAAFVAFGLAVGFMAGFVGFFLALIPPFRPLFRWIVRRSVFLLACLVTLFALFYAVENWRGARAWADFKRAAEARGQWVEVQNIVPPQVPDEQNVAAAPLFKPLWNEFDPEWVRLRAGPTGLTNEADRLKFTVAHERADPPPREASAHWMAGRRTDLKLWQDHYRNPKGLPNGMDAMESEPGMVTSLPEPVAKQFPVADQPQTPAADVLLALSRHDGILEELRAACERPHSRFPVRYDEGFNALLPHLNRIKSINQFLALRVAAQLEAGRTDEAAADVELSFRVVDLVRGEPLLISHLVRMGQVQIAISAFWEGLAEQRWTDAQLAAFERQLRQFDFLADFEIGMSGERAISSWTMDYLQRNRDPGAFEYGDPSARGADGMERAFGAVLFHLIPRGWFDQNKVSIGRMHLELMLPVIDRDAAQVSPSKVTRLTSLMNQRLTKHSPYNWVAGLLLPALGNASTRFAQAQTAVNLARVACALERHRLAHGGYPETLDALAPKFIPKLPHDLIDGQPLRYRRAGDSSVLYSIGWNEIDDGGTVALTKEGSANWKEGDWVWRYPDR
jgi:hypothetical protein